MATLTKLQNPNVLGLGDPASTQCHTIGGFAIGALRFATMTALHLKALSRLNEGQGCDYWVLTETSGTPRPKTVGFCNLVEVVIAPVSKKKLAVK